MVAAIGHERGLVPGEIPSTKRESGKGRRQRKHHLKKDFYSRHHFIAFLFLVYFFCFLHQLFLSFFFVSRRFFCFHFLFHLTQILSWYFKFYFSVIFFSRQFFSFFFFFFVYFFFSLLSILLAHSSCSIYSSRFSPLSRKQRRWNSFFLFLVFSLSTSSFSSLFLFSSPLFTLLRCKDSVKKFS